MKLFKNHKRLARFTTVTAAIAAVMTLGWAVATQTSLLNPVFGHDKAYANPPADACIHLVNGIQVNLQNANADIRLESPCGVRQFQMKAWYAPSASGEPHDQQVLFATSDTVTARTRDANPTHINVKMLPQGCFYQVDVIDVTNPPNGGFPIVAAVTGGNHNCIPTPPPPPPPAAQFACTGLSATPGVIDQNNGNQAFTLNAGASVSNATIVSYNFTFGDGTSASVPSSATSASAMHTYAPGTYTANVVVNVRDGAGAMHATNPADCQTTVTVKPPTPPEKKLTCDSLTATPGDVAENGSQSFTLTAKATAQNVTITNYRFVFGDSSADATVNTASTTHTYAPGTYTAQVFVNSGDSNHTNVTSDACKVQIKVKEQVKKLSCDSLTATAGDVDQSNGNQSFTLTAKATAQNVTITSYVFNFGDGQNQTVTTGDTTATADHTYAPGDYTATVSVKAGDQTATSDKCKVKIHVAKQPKANLTCTSLGATAGDVAEDGSQSFHFTATASAQNVTITSFVFTFGDGSTDATVTTDQTTAAADHTFAPGTFTTTVVVNGTDAAGKPVASAATNACKFKVTVAPPQPKNPNITIMKTVDGVESKQVNFNQNFVYQLVIKNTGEKDLTNAKVTDTAPAGVTLLSADKGSVDNNSFSFTIPSLKVGESVTVNITAVVKEAVAGNMVNTACVDTPDMEGSPDACDTATVTVPPVVTPPPTTPPTTPQVLGVTTLVNTGPGSVAALVAVVAAVSAFAHRLFIARKLSN
jgi:uncharacterized repeat protein (TIGR01451 family)